MTKSALGVSVKVGFIPIYGQWMEVYLKKNEWRE